MAKKLKVLFVSAEVAPFSSVGGLSQVSYFLPRALMKMGEEVAIFTPKYGIIDETKFPMRVLVSGLKVPIGDGKFLICNVKTLRFNHKGEPTVYFLENMEYFEKRANVYGYSDDHIRFGLLSRGAIEFVRSVFACDIIHCNDWHTGYMINDLRTNPDYKNDPILRKVATVLSVHNIFQGVFDFEHASEMDFDDGKGELAPFYSDRFFKQNPLKRGIIYADLVNTVSETYATEIVKQEFGRGLHDLFKELRDKLYGVLNGLDYTEFNPATDKLIAQNFNVKTLELKKVNKRDLQRQFGLNLDENVPVLAIWGRLDTQKGIDLVIDVITNLLDESDLQFIVMGQPGDDKYRTFFTDLERRYPGRVGTHLQSNFALPRKIAAGADIFLAPSKYEPGGIVTMEALRYGTVPVVRATGGLADSVANYDVVSGNGTGFVFKNFSSGSFLIAVTRALEAYKNKTVWHKIVRAGMTQDFSWNKSAEKYLDLYFRVMEFRKEALRINPPRAFRQMVS